MLPKYDAISAAARCCATDGDPANTTGSSSRALSRGSKNGSGKLARSSCIASGWPPRRRVLLLDRLTHSELWVGSSQMSV